MRILVMIFLFLIVSCKNSIRARSTPIESALRCVYVLIELQPFWPWKPYALWADCGRCSVWCNVGRVFFTWAVSPCMWRHDSSLFYSALFTHGLLHESSAIRPASHRWEIGMWPFKNIQDRTFQIWPGKLVKPKSGCDSSICGTVSLTSSATSRAEHPFVCHHRCCHFTVYCLLYSFIMYFTRILLVY